MTELPPIEKRAIEPITFSLSFKHVNNIPAEELAERAMDKDVVYIDAVTEDNEDDGLPMVDFCDEDGWVWVTINSVIDRNIHRF